MSPPSERAERLEELVTERELDALIVGDLVRPGDSGPDAIANIRWLTGFTGTSALAVVGPGIRGFVTDFRYTERARQEVGDGFDRHIAVQRLIPELASHLKGRVGFDDAATSVANLAKLESSLAPGVELVAAGGLVERLRRHKDEAELQAIAEAAKLADAALEWAIEQGFAGRKEIDVARAFEGRIRELGGEPAFSAIVAAGEDGALPHAEPSEREINTGELLVFDFGSKFDGYCSDCTRTLATGTVDDHALEVYELVERAQQRGLEAVKAGVSCRDADGAAREVIEAGGHGERFGHGLGHGVGLEVHEGPRLTKSADGELRAGNVVTVEPGIYLPGEFGVRIEDLVAVTDGGREVLTGFPKSLLDVG
jgi:Xaa-Pro aminopeptidase